MKKAQTIPELLENYGKDMKNILVSFMNESFELMKNLEKNLDNDRIRLLAERSS